MPLLVGPFVGIALGAALAWLGRGDASRDDDESFRARAAIVALFAALVLGPACGYFLIFAGDWSLFYLADSRRVPSALLLLAVMADVALVVAAFAVGHVLARRRALRALAALALAPVAIVAALVLAFASKLRIDGTFHQVTSRFGTTPVSGSPLGFAIVWMGAAIAAGMFVTARALLERPRAVLPPPPEGRAPRAREPMLGRRR